MGLPAFDAGVEDWSCFGAGMFGHCETGGRDVAAGGRAGGAPRGVLNVLPGTGPDVRARWAVTWMWTW